MNRIYDITTDEEYLEYRTVLSKCTGNISATADLVKMTADGRSYPINNQVIIEGEALTVIKGDYVYISIKTSDEECYKFTKTFSSSLQDEVASIFSVVYQDIPENTMYQLTMVQPIAVYKDGNSVMLVGKFDDLMYHTEIVNFEALDREVESEINYMLEMEDEEEAIQNKMKEESDTWLDNLSKRY